MFPVVMVLGAVVSSKSQIQRQELPSLKNRFSDMTKEEGHAVFGCCLPHDRIRLGARFTRLAMNSRGTVNHLLSLGNPSLSGLQLEV